MLFLPKNLRLNGSNINWMQESLSNIIKMYIKSVWIRDNISWTVSITWIFFEVNDAEELTKRKREEKNKQRVKRDSRRYLFDSFHSWHHVCHKITNCVTDSPKERHSHVHRRTWYDDSEYGYEYQGWKIIHKFCSQFAPMSILLKNHSRLTIMIQSFSFSLKLSYRRRLLRELTNYLLRWQVLLISYLRDVSHKTLRLVS
jgi:hypothetical protein